MTRQEDRTKRTLIRSIRHGSSLYGTRTTTSDNDLRSIVLPSVDDILLTGNLDYSGRESSKADSGATNSSTDTDHTTVSLRRYLELLVDGDPSSVDILFAPDWADVTTQHPIWQTLYSHRARLISRRMAPRMLSYCRKRIGRYGMPGSVWHAKKALVDLAQTWIESDLEFATLGSIWARHSQDIWALPAELDVDIEGDLVYMKVAGRKYLPHMEAAWIYKYIAERLEAHDDPVASPVVGQDFGDWKILAHAIRTAQQTAELFKTGELVFPRPNREILVGIRQGGYDYSLVETTLVTELGEATMSVDESSLPAEPDKAWIDDLLRYAHRFVLKEYFRG